MSISIAHKLLQDSYERVKIELGDAVEAKSFLTDELSEVR